MEGKGQHEILPSSQLATIDRDSGGLTGKDSHPLPASDSFPGSHLQVRVRITVESGRSLSTRIWQVFPLILILVFPWLFEGITGISLLENPSVSPQPT